MATDPQSLDETAKAHISTTVTKLIQATTAKTKAELPLHSIVAASLSKQHELVSTLAEHIAGEVPAEAREVIEELVTQNKDITESVTKQITIFTQDDLGISLFADEKVSSHRSIKSLKIIRCNIYQIARPNRYLFSRETE